MTLTFTNVIQLASLQPAAIPLHVETSIDPRPPSSAASIGQQRLSRLQFDPQPPSANLPLEDPLAPLLLVEPPRVPLLEPLPESIEPPEVDPLATPSARSPPSFDARRAPSSPPSSPALFGVLLHAAKAMTPAVHTAPSLKTFPIAHSYRSQRIMTKRICRCNADPRPSPSPWSAILVA
jgi:hypothetical protein